MVIQNFVSMFRSRWARDFVHLNKREISFSLSGEPKLLYKQLAAL
jgi:hypothetical protein